MEAVLVDEKPGGTKLRERAGERLQFNSAASKRSFEKRSPTARFISVYAI